MNHPMLRGTGMFPELLFPESSPSDLAEELWEPAQVRVLGGPCCAPSFITFCRNQDPAWAHWCCGK